MCEYSNGYAYLRGIVAVRNLTNQNNVVLENILIWFKKEYPFAKISMTHLTDVQNFQVCIAEMHKDSSWVFSPYWCILERYRAFVKDTFLNPYLINYNLKNSRKLTKVSLHN